MLKFRVAKVWRLERQSGLAILWLTDCSPGMWAETSLLAGTRPLKSWASLYRIHDNLQFSN